LIRRVKRNIVDLALRAGYDLEKVSGSAVPYRLFKRLDLGRDPLSDARIILAGQVHCVFDVGAHVGETAMRLVSAFPEARIYSFEPDPQSFDRLRAAANSVRRIEAVNAAVGDRDGKAAFFVNRFDQTSSLLETAPGASQYLWDQTGLERRSQIEVPVITLDRFCAARGITRIDVLKLDAQGYELRILDGTGARLNGEAIPLIYLEVCFVRIYEGQPLFPEIYRYLFDRGYRLVWLYDSSFRTHFYALGANALFVHESIGMRLGPSQRGTHAMAATV
jgi:FkbM family methyltransferase